MKTYKLDFYGTIEVEANSYEEAVAAVGSDNSDKHCKAINNEILSNVNFNF